MHANETSVSRGRIWFEALTDGGSSSPSIPSVLAADANLDGDAVRFIAVVPNPASRFPRARRGEVGVEEGWTIAKLGRQVMAETTSTMKRPIVAVVDLPGQAYGRREEMLGIFLSCAAATDMYVSARLAGHPVVTLVVGQALSGGFLAHGYQAHRILALDDPGVSIHAMGKNAAARVTRRSLEELEALSRTILPLAYDIHSAARLGLVRHLIKVSDPRSPAPADIRKVRTAIAEAIGAARREMSSPNRDEMHFSQRFRPKSLEVSRRLAEQWNAAPD
jgi:biotin-independent malonate decarboxylase gamma subunit